MKSFRHPSLLFRIYLLICIPYCVLAQTLQPPKAGTAETVAFIRSLSDMQRKIAVFPFDEKNRFDWHFLPAYSAPRTGLAVKDMDSSQKKLLYAVIRQYLSKDGYEKARDIMGFEYLLRELEPTKPTRIPENYYVAIYGNPATDSVWGWKFSGHHLALNFTIVIDRLAFAPFFFGNFPAEVKEGKRKGTRILHNEEDLGFELIRSLDTQQQSSAIFQSEAFNEVVTTNAQRVVPLAQTGIKAADLHRKQKKMLEALIALYLHAMPPESAAARMSAIKKESFDEIRFGWAGALVAGQPHYYRIQGKSFLIEFDNSQNNANHIHTVWRDFNGDFGADLLKEHYLTSHVR